MHQLETPPPAPQVSPRPSQPLRKFSPKLVVVGDVLAPRSPDPFQWRTARQGSKVSQPGEGVLLPAEPGLVQQRNLACYGRSLPFNFLPPCGLPALSKAQEGGFRNASQAPPNPPQQPVFSEQPGWITPSQVVLEIRRCGNPLLATGCKGGFRNASPASQGPPHQPVFSEQPGWITPSQVVLEIRRRGNPLLATGCKGGFRNASQAPPNPPQQPVFSGQHGQDYFTSQTVLDHYGCSLRLSIPA
ncbi:hypothetical protein D5F01_LYC11052 [Larimichthys crocea]|uniref:Uncharacterized protein n=1 Tax=Larimichthys crocea TaxID=215358 RepID=A0A6G0IJE4_LARCR|nr:hypothetical protein D5F01_LYC11052 [Larimichthys crocea]